MLLVKLVLRREQAWPGSLAYILTTAFHESAKTMAAISEFSQGTKYDNSHKMKMGKGPKGRIFCTHPDQLYYGRGLVQFTWYENYDRVGQLLHLDLLNNPDMALHLDVSVRILVEGMVNGWFTGAKLANYFYGPKANAKEARRIVNGTDKALLIAGYYTVFLDALFD